MNYAAMASAIREERKALQQDEVKLIKQVIAAHGPDRALLAAWSILNRVFGDILMRHMPSCPPSFKRGGITSPANQGEHIIPKHIPFPWND